MNRYIIPLIYVYIKAKNSKILKILYNLGKRKIVRNIIIKE